MVEAEGVFLRTAKEINKFRAMYGLLLDPEATQAQRSLDLDPARPPTFRALLRQIQHEFRLSGTSAVEIRIGGTVLGISTPEVIDRYQGTAGPGTVALGSGDRASFSGESSQYRALKYVCTENKCKEDTLRTFHDERVLPRCPVHRLPMEYREWI